MAPRGQLPRHAPRPSQSLSDTSRALPLMIWSAPSAQAGTHSPHPSHNSSSMRTISRCFMVSTPSLHHEPNPVLDLHQRTHFRVLLRRFPLRESSGLGAPIGMTLNPLPRERARTYEMPTLLAVSLGALGGFLYGRYVGCRSGACPLTSNQYVAAAYGAFLGFLASGGLSLLR